MLKMLLSQVEKLQEHGAKEYPGECCGALLGHEQGADRAVTGLLPLRNQREDSPRNRFSIQPEDVLRAQKDARASGAELIGWYHSHPDAPARPSDFDRQQAWPWYSYVIIQVEKGEPREIRSWRLADDRGSYAEEGIELISRAPAG